MTAEFRNDLIMNKALTPHIRMATLNDIPAIQAVYAHHVLHGTATFEEDVPCVEEMEERFHTIMGEGYPYIVAELDGQVCGYAYLGRYRPRRAYRFTLEDSIYIHKDFTGKGIGTLLLTELIKRAERGPWHLVIAVIGDSTNHASINVHKKLGFELVGVEPETGFKFGRWIDTVIMYKRLHEDRQ